MDISHQNLNKTQKKITNQLDDFIEYWNRSYKETIPSITLTASNYETLMKCFGKKKPKTVTYRNIPVCSK